MMRRFLTALLGLTILLGAGRRAEAQEIQLTGPLAGAPAVRDLRLHREHRLEIAPVVSFTLLDEYQRTILAGARLNYNLTDWFAIGAWGAVGAAHIPAALSDHIQEVTADRRQTENPESTDRRITDLNVGPTFKNQLAKIDWVLSPQITFVPFRGKLSIFQKIFVDTDAYVFGGPAFIGVTERANCQVCTNSFDTASRTAITGTFGLGLTFYLSKFLSLGLEWRGLPFAWNAGGFDNHGGGPDKKFPDSHIDDSDREFKFNQLLSVSLGIYLPTNLKTSD